MSKVGAIGSTAVLAAAIALSAATSAYAETCPGNPNALGTSRVLTVGPSEYSQLGLMQYPQTLPLNDKEVVLTFDDGPLPPWSNKILDVLTAQCVKATYFIVGEMAKAFPAVVRREYEAGYAIGTHSQSHPIRFERLTGEKLDYQIDQGIASVGAALGDPNKVAPFFRIPGLGRSPAVDEALTERSLVVFSVDVVADDWFRHISPAQIVQRAMSRLEQRGKGILLLHDIHPWTAAAVPELLKQLKERGWHVVQVVPSAPGAPRAPMVAAAPRTLKLASAIAEPSVVDLGSAPHSWPKPDLVTPDDIVMPVPDATAFELNEPLQHGSGTTEQAGTPAAWPVLSDAKPPSPKAKLPAPGLRDIGINMKGQRLVGADLGLRPSLDVSPPHERARLHRGHLRPHRSLRARRGGEGHRAKLGSPRQKVASLQKPAH